MTTALITHSACLAHTTPPGHPEQVARLTAINAALSGADFAALSRFDAPLCSDADLLLAHPQSHIDAIRAAAPASGFRSLDPDTHMSPGSLEAALRAVGGAMLAVDRVIAGKADNAFVAMRPPGHHAEKSRAMGFCFFGNIALAAIHAMERHGLDRVAIVDFDVHHGNGTQDIVWEDKRILFVSSHQVPLYPGTGAADETGAHGNVLNLPLAPEAGGQAFRQAWTNEAFPAIRAHRPDMLFISAGFDGHRDDPLANLNLTEDDFAWVTQQICDIADETADGRVVSALEGGYDLHALAASVAAHVKVLMGRGQ
ncbi:MAG: histone deacetylase family protein [Rhodobacteraceae bacterium]|nr:histone deacetylase family protein [Paracoccaceae bacterium]